MVGNDVVDLGDSDTDPRTLSPRFDQRVFGTQERRSMRLASASALPEGEGTVAPEVRERWCLWAAKEAAYKLARKRDGDVVFSPVRFEVSLGARIELSAGEGDPLVGWRRHGYVLHGSDRFELELLEGDRLVHAIARLPGTPGELVVSAAEAAQCGDLATDDVLAPSAAVRQLARRVLAEELGVEAGSLVIQKHGRVPHLHRAGHPVAGVDLSLSHHGAFVAFASCLGPDLAASLDPPGSDVVRRRTLTVSRGNGARVAGRIAS